MEFALLVGAYLAGSVPVGLIVGRLVKGVDIRDYGSGNIGTTNAMRVLGGGWAVLVFIIDASKGFLPVTLALYLGFEPLWVALAALGAVAGHNWPVYLRFQGGKGVATSLGALIALSVPTALGAAAVWGLVVLVWGYASLASLLALGSAPVTFYFLGAPLEYVVLGVVLLLAAVFRHQANIRRLLAGEELPFGRRVPLEPGPPEKPSE